MNLTQTQTLQGAAIFGGGAGMMVTGTLTSDGSTSISFAPLLYAGIISGKASYNPVGLGFYVVGDQIIWSTVATKWRIYKNAVIVFESSENVATPDLVTTWTPVGAATGTPTVTAIL